MFNEKPKVSDRKAYHDYYNRRPTNVIKRTYHNIIRRTSGLDPRTPRSYGLEVGFTEDEFLLWTLNETRFWALYEDWVRHGYARDWAPSIDRLDDDLGYTPENVQWIVWHKNHHKPRKRAGRHFITYNGETKHLKEWARTMRINIQTLRGRLKHGWTLEEAFTTRPNPNLRRSPKPVLPHEDQQRAA